MRSAPEQLNPFAFPSETRVRFTLLILAALFVSIDLGFILADRLGLPSPAILAAKVIEASQMPPLGTAEQAGGAQAYQQYLALNWELMSTLIRILSFPFGLTAATLLLAYVLYRLHPRWVRAPRSAAPTHQDPELVKAVAQFASITAISAPLDIELAGTSKTSTLRVFGFPKRYTLYMGGQWRVVLRKAPEAFRVAVLHELAHIVNQDVGRTYFSHALWIALVALVVLPVIGMVSLRFVIDTFVPVLREGVGSQDWMFVLTRSLPRLCFIYLQVAITLLVVAAVRASLLRARELYADWQVALWGARAPIDALLQRQDPSIKSMRGGRWWAIWRYHPSPPERLDTLRNPERLFRLAPDLAFLVGFLFALVGVNVVIPAGTVGVSIFTLAEIWISAGLADEATSSLLLSSASLAAPLLLLILAVGLGSMLLGASYLLVETLGLEVQRAAVADLVTQRTGVRPYLQLLGPAGLAAFGVQVGAIFAPYSPFAVSGVPLIVVPLWTVLLTALIWLWLIHAYAVAGVILGTHAKYAPPVLKRRLCSLILFGLACTMLVPTFMSQQIVLPLLSQAGGLRSEGALQSLLIALGLGLASYAIIGGASWIAVLLWRRAQRGICPGCGLPMDEAQAAGRHCEQCGADSAPWLFAHAPNTAPAPEQRSTRRVSWRQRLTLVVGTVAGIGLAAWVSLAVLAQIWIIGQAAAVGSPAGTYRVHGSNFQEQVYSGSLAIAQNGPLYQFDWDTDAGSFTGTGILDRSVLAVAYGRPELCAVVVYQIQADGSLSGRWTVPGGQEIGAEQASPVAGARADDIGGVYQVRSPGVSSGAFSGTLTIVPSGSTYRLTWETDRISFTGTGIHQGDTLAAVYGAQDRCGLVLYQIRNGETLDGVWTVQGAAELGTEQAQRKE